MVTFHIDPKGKVLEDTLPLGGFLLFLMLKK